MHLVNITFIVICSLLIDFKHINQLVALALAAHLDARPTGDQAVVGSTAAGSATFFCGD